MDLLWTEQRGHLLDITSPCGILWTVSTSCTHRWWRSKMSKNGLDIRIDHWNGQCMKMFISKIYSSNFDEWCFQPRIPTWRAHSKHTQRCPKFPESIEACHCSRLSNFVLCWCGIICTATTWNRRRGQHLCLHWKQENVQSIWSFLFAFSFEPNLITMGNKICWRFTSWPTVIKWDRFEDEQCIGYFDNMTMAECVLTTHKSCKLPVDRGSWPCAHRKPWVTEWSRCACISVFRMQEIWRVLTSIWMWKNIIRWNEIKYCTQ